MSDKSDIEWLCDLCHREVDSLYFVDGREFCDACRSAKTSNKS